MRAPFLEAISKKFFDSISALGIRNNASKYRVYSCGLFFTVALTLGQNPLFEIASNLYGAKMVASDCQLLPTILSMVVKPGHIQRFLYLFTSGVRLPVTIGDTVKATVCGQLGVAVDYFEECIQTIFLNFKAVDTPETARVEDGAIVALSAAMPGLVGATLRKGGTYATLRRAISFGKNAGTVITRKGFITLKLLNMVAYELGPAFLARGVAISRAQLVELLTTKLDLQGACQEIRLDKTMVTWMQLQAQDWANQHVLLRVYCRHDP